MDVILLVCGETAVVAVAATDGVGSCSDGLCDGGGGPGGVGIESGQLEAAAASFWASLFFFFLAFLLLLTWGGMGLKPGYCGGP